MLDLSPLSREEASKLYPRGCRAFCCPTYGYAYFPIDAHNFQCSGCFRAIHFGSYKPIGKLEAYHSTRASNMLLHWMADTADEKRRD